MHAKKILLGVLKYTTLIIGALVAIVPLVVVFFGSFKTTDEFNATAPFTLPENFLNFSNYIRAFTEGKMLLGFFNTIILLVLSCIGAVLTGTMTAYVLSRFHFKFNRLVKNLFLFATLVPSITTQVATFQIINAMGIYNTRLAGLVLFIGTDIISVYIFLQFLENIPRSLDESGIIDGASYFTIFWRIILPLLKPAIATVVIIKGVGIYNDFYTPFLYMPKTELYMVSTALFKFKGPYGAQWEVICAGVMIVVIPTLLIFLLLQKHIYNGMVQGAVKE